ncbi:response regulator transcription factor [Zooshikella sp. RANM57]|uniref:response regulator transcription factor n=1 Tax=Zooshikella sp. RANM57 TaxID=3425863 RepID=UPI003D6DDD1D
MSMHNNRHTMEIKLQHQIESLDLSQQILIVEDVAPERARLEIILSKEGYSTHTARNGQEALTILEDTPIGIIICDWRMPKMNGLDLLNYLNLYHPIHPYFIMLTGQGSASDTIAALDQGADDFIRKPFLKDELRARVQAGSRVVEMIEQLRSNTI